MDFPLYYLLPLVAGFLYPVGSLFLKQAMGEGAGTMRLVFISNLGISFCFLALLFFNDESPRWELLAWPVAAGIAFFLGQILTLLALRVGDVSIQAPLMGTKTVFVALTAAFIQPDGIPLTWWLGAATTALAVFLMGGASLRRFSHASRCVLLSLAAAACYGLTDTLIEAKSPSFGRFSFVIVMTQGVGVLSLGMIPFFRQPLRAFPRKAWFPALAAGLTLGVQALLLGIALTMYGRATPMNVFYSSRGLWGIVLVWFAGHLFANRERYHVSRQTMMFRFAGAALLIVAIVLVLV